MSANNTDTNNPNQPTGPTEAAVAALSQIMAKIEALSERDRGFVLNRLARVYFGGKNAKETQIAVSAKHGRDKKSKSSKTSWKSEWEKSPEYLAWQAHIQTFKERSQQERDNAQAQYQALRADAFRVRDGLKNAEARKPAEADPHAAKTARSTKRSRSGGATPPTKGGGRGTGKFVPLGGQAAQNSQGGARNALPQQQPTSATQEEGQIGNEHGVQFDEDGMDE